MFCTEENRNNCCVEKMGCEDCFYNNDENMLEEIDNLRKKNNVLQKERDYFKKMYLETNNIFLKKI